MNKIIIPKNKDEAVKNLNDPVIRAGVTQNSFLMFLQIYFPHHMSYKLAPMHMDMISICESKEIELGLIMAFRGSGKSTIISNAYPLWAILGSQKKHFVIIIAKTIVQAKVIMKNIKLEAESDSFLKKDLGPFKEASDEWGAESLTFTKQNAKIMVLSIEKSLKGLKYMQYRPDLIICDDMEDDESTRTRDGREKTYDKYVREIVPLGDKGTKILHVGNMLHDNSLIMRLSRDVQENDKTRIFKRFPIIDDENNILWLGKFPAMEDIEKQRRTVNNEIAWHLEYLLKIISNVGQIVHQKDIQFYDEIPPIIRRRDDDWSPQRYVVVGVDLAISEKSNADYTAIVPILFDHVNDKWNIYVLKEFVHKRLDFPSTVDTIVTLNKTLRSYTSNVQFAIESVGYQEVLLQALRQQAKDSIKLIGMNLGLSKEERFRSITPMFANKQIFFPSYGAESMLEEILGFGREKHDDLLDAFVYSLIRASTAVMGKQRVFIAE